MSGFVTSPRIAWGPGAIEQLSGLGAHRALLLVDPAVARNSGHRRATEELAKSDTVVEVVPDLPNPDRVDTVRALGQRARELGVDWIVGIGGGRTLDGAKAARLLAVRPELDLRSAVPLLELPEPATVHLAALPTTSGSGSEASWSADLWTEEGGPLEVAHRGLVPDWSLLDPSLATGLSSEHRLEGALETLAQAAEAYLSAWANPFSDALALAAVGTVIERLPHALRWSDDPDAGAALHYAATAAGLAASNSQRGLAHALARALEPTTGLGYARLLGIVTPTVLDYDYPSARERSERLALAAPPPETGGRASLTVQLRRLYERFSFPTSLRAAGVPPEAVIAARTGVVERTLRSPAALANPRVPSPTDVGGLVDVVLGPA